MPSAFFALLWGFWIWVLCFFSLRVRRGPQSSASWVVGITGVYYHTYLFVKVWSNFLPRLVLNLNPPISLPPKSLGLQAWATTPSLTAELFKNRVLWHILNRNSFPSSWWKQEGSFLWNSSWETSQTCRVKLLSEGPLCMVPFTGVSHCDLFNPSLWWFLSFTSLRFLFMGF
jgi:hypothetical protein